MPNKCVRTALMLAASLALGACASLGGLRPQASPLNPATLAAKDTLGSETVAAGAWPTDRWWTAFGDPQLDALIQEALTHSATLTLARARLDKAVALAGITDAARFPQADASAAVTRQRYSENGIFPPPIGGATYTQGDLALDLRYELDLWGKNRAAYDRALGQAKAAEIDAAAARLLLATAVAHAYVQLQRDFDQLDVANETVKQREGILDLTRQRVHAGIDSKVDLDQAQAAIPAAREAVIRLQEAIALTRNQLAALLGEGPDRGLTITRPHLQPVSTLALPTRVPADLIGRRPDVVAERWRVRAAARGIDNAKAQFYPNIDLNALAGTESIDLGKLLQAGSAAPLLGAAIHLPLFEGGRLRSQLAGADADYDAAVAHYNDTLIAALRDVVDQLASLRFAHEQQIQLQAALGSANAAYALATQRYRAGIGNYLQVLSAESLVLDQRDRDVDNQARTLDASIDLLRALGGGFEDEYAPTKKRIPS